jgi:uncharacterized protein (DUF736 family)
MADFELKDLTGNLFKNDKKGNEKAPDYRGECSVAGEKLSIAAWLKTSAKGTKYMSLSFSPPFEKSNQPTATRQAARDSMDDLSDDVPF